VLIAPTYNHSEDAIKANNIFSILMGEDVKRRKEFIETYAKEVVEIDI
jgi:DNA gyrase subunit B